MTASPAARIPSPGFTEPVTGAQRSFRAVLDALARPTRSVPLDTGPQQPPPGLSRTAAALALSLCDESTPVWLDESPATAAGLAAWLTFHTGAAPVADRSEAAFAFVAAGERLPELAGFAQGSDEAPHGSTTVIVSIDAPFAGQRFLADGPGFERAAPWRAPVLPASFAAQWAANHAGFPRGVDLVFAAGHELTALPRTTRLVPVRVRTEQPVRTEHEEA